MKITTSESSPIAVSKDITPSPSTATGATTSSAGSLEGVKVTSAISESKSTSAPLSFKFENLPDDILRKVIFLTPEMPSELEGSYRQEYENVLVALQKKDPHLVHQLASWQQIHQEWLLAEGENKATFYQKLQAVEERLPLQARAATAFCRAGVLMSQWNSFQENWLHDMKNQDKSRPYLLRGATKVNDLLAWATANIKALLEIVQTYQQKKEHEEIESIPFVVEKYKMVIGMVTQALDEYTSLIAKTEANDAQAIRLFLQQQEQRKTVMIAKSALCNSLLEYHQRMEACRSIFLTRNSNSRDVERYFTRIDSYLNEAIQTASSHAQALLEKGGDYCLQRAEEIARNGLSERSQNLNNAARVAINAGRAFGSAEGVTTPQGKAAYDKALDYDLQRVEHIAQNGFTEKAEILDQAAQAMIMAGFSFEEAAQAISPQAKIAFEQAGNDKLQEAEEIARNGFTELSDQLSSKAYAAITAAEALEKEAKAAAVQARVSLGKVE